MNTYKLPQVYLKILKEEDYKLILDLYSNKETAYWSGIKKIQSKQSRTGGDISPPVFSLFMKGSVDSNRNS